MGAIGVVQGEGQARVSLINFRSRYRRAPLACTGTSLSPPSTSPGIHLALLRVPLVPPVSAPAAPAYA